MSGRSGQAQAVTVFAHQTPHLYATRLEWLLAETPSHYLVEYDATVMEWPDTITLIREQVPELRYILDERIDALYRAWSEETYSAGWVDSPNLGEFRAWLTSPAFNKESE